MVASRRYGPIGRFNNAYEPLSSVTTSRRMPVSVWVATTVTPGRTAPLVSTTLPLICAVAWAHAFVAVSRRTNTPTRAPLVRFIQCLLLVTLDAIAAGASVVVDDECPCQRLVNPGARHKDEWVAREDHPAGPRVP